MIFFHKSDYKQVVNPDLKLLKEKYSNVWKNKTFPEKQWRRVEKQLRDIDNVPEFKAIIDLIKATRLKDCSLLEIGCSSGYLSEVLKIAHVKVKYEGTDYSSEFINFANKKYPNIRFAINDAIRLNYKNRHFDVVVSGGCILHIVDYEKAIFEAARVAKKYVIFHRTPVFHAQPTSFFTKTAYGSEMLELTFNEEELTDLFRKNHLLVAKIRTLSSDRITMKSYLCQKA